MSNNAGDAIEALLSCPTGEADFVDYKGSLNWSNDVEKAELVKDIAGFANSKGGYLIFGIENKTMKPIDLTEDQLKLFDQTAFSSFLRKYLSPIPVIRVHRYPHQGKTFGVVEVDSFAVAPCIVTTALGGRIFPGDIFIRTAAASTEKISTEQEMRKLLDLCLLRKKEEIKNLLLSALPKEPVSQGPLFDVMTARTHAKINDEWSNPEWKPFLLKGRLWMAVPKEKQNLDLLAIERTVRDSLIEYRGYDVPWSKAEQPVRRGDHVDYIWPKKGAVWVSDFPGVYASVDRSGRISYYVSYWEESPARPAKGQGKRFALFTTLQSNLLFIGFVRNFMKKLSVSDMKLRFVANDTADRPLFMDDPRRAPLFRDYKCLIDEIVCEIDFSDGDSIVEKTVELTREILVNFHVSEDLINRLKELLLSYCSDFFNRTDLLIET